MLGVETREMRIKLHRYSRTNGVSGMGVGFEPYDIEARHRMELVGVERGDLDARLGNGSG